MKVQDLEYLYSRASKDPWMLPTDEDLEWIKAMHVATPLLFQLVKAASAVLQNVDAVSGDMEMVELRQAVKALSNIPLTNIESLHVKDI